MSLRISDIQSCKRTHDYIKNACSSIVMQLEDLGVLKGQCSGVESIFIHEEYIRAKLLYRIADFNDYNYLLIPTNVFVDDSAREHYFAEREKEVADAKAKQAAIEEQKRLDKAKADYNKYLELKARFEGNEQ